ncbi:hypothetical protein [Synechococcus sp. MIT S9504]|uniref:hypothetical protein n=1 Tax=Synechococcus sp. MIT S9504 TaxID=1801628 RepID=UPI0007BBF9FF|nr:hypothetical protein [Synechococcus sp. MIT S9504]KZR87942.1 hypothetical protein MITS9504_00366 [Synechococcus sp. MIT S9504]
MKSLLTAMFLLSSVLPTRAGEWTTFEHATETAYYQVRQGKRSENISYIETRLIASGHHIPAADSDYQVNCKELVMVDEAGKKQKIVDGVWISTESGRPSSTYIHKLFDFACQ